MSSSYRQMVQEIIECVCREKERLVKQVAQYTQVLNISKECMVFLSSSIVTFFCRNEIGELSNKCAIMNYKLYDSKKKNLVSY